MERDVANLRAVVRHVQSTKPEADHAVGLEILVQITHDLDAKWSIDVDLDELGKQEGTGMEWLFDGTFSSEPSDDPEVLTPTKIFQVLMTEIYNKVQMLHRTIEIIKEAKSEENEEVGHA